MLKWCFRNVFFSTMVIVLFLFSLNTVAAANPFESLTELKTLPELEKIKKDQNAILEQLINNKDSLKENHKKISTDLLQLIDEDFLLPGQTKEELQRQMQNLKQFRLEPNQQRGAMNENNELVYVYIYLTPSAETCIVDKYAWEITDRDEYNHLVVAWVEVKNLEALASDNAVQVIRTVIPPRVNKGSVISEGDILHNADQVRTLFGQDGTGIKVGIISDGVDNWTTARNSGDLPADLTILSNAVGGDEGTAMLEIIHDLAPGAKLYFHDCGNNKVAFNKAISNLVAVGCKVVCDDIGWISEPFFEDGIIARHVAYVLAQNNIIYVSSAGNDAQSHYQGRYYNQGDGFHDFSEGSSDFKNVYIEIKPSETIQVVLQWDDKFGSSSNDYDLLLWNPSLELLEKSTNPQTGGSDPIEWIEYTNNTNYTIDALVDVYKYSGNSKTLEVFLYAGTTYTNNLYPGDSVFGHPAVPGAIAVGAINSPDPTQIASYSSRGPVTIRYPSKETRNKPDVCGIDGVRVTGAGNFPSTFYGTSASAPHVAAIAALLQAQYPEKTAAEIRSLILSKAVDLGNPGFDYIYGNGRADALRSVRGGDVSPPAYKSTTISGTNKIVTLTFSENLVANTANLKEAVTFAADGTTFAPLGTGDTVSLSNNTLVLTLSTALTGSTNKIRLAANSLKDAAGNVLTSMVTTEAIQAEILGDLNGDNVVNITDLLWMAQYIGIKQGDDDWENVKKADLNNDESIDILDLIQVAEYIGA